MLKYVNTGIVFQEIPDEVTLAINISNCPCRCPGCHSKYLWGDIGNILDTASLEKIIKEYCKEITCIAFMGGDSDPQAVSELSRFLHKEHPQFKVAWYSGRVRFPSHIDKNDFDYVKIGPYLKHLGCLKDSGTNQRLYKRISENNFDDITYRFWKK